MEESDLPRTPVAFADPHAKLHPIHTKAATWLSAAYVFSHGLETPEIEASLTKAAKLWGIQEDLETLKVLKPEVEKKASNTSERQFALQVDFGETRGGFKNIYPINNCGEVITSAETLMKDASIYTKKMPVEFFRDASLAIVKAALKHGVTEDELHPRILASGVDRMPNFDHAREVARMRKYAGANDEEVSIYTDIVNAAEDEWDKKGSLDNKNELFEPLANLWHAADEQLGVKYARLAPDFYTAMFSGEPVEGIVKAAREVVVISGVMIPKTEIASLSDRRIEQNFTKSAQEEIKTLRDLAMEKPEQVTKKAAEMENEARVALLSVLSSM